MCVHVECDSGFYGQGCVQKCSCPSGAACDPMTGVCQRQCPAGKKGENCDEGEFIWKLKSRTAVMSKTPTGISIVMHHLYRGMRFGAEPSCIVCCALTDCADGNFGIGCSESCDCSRASCDKVTGQCRCPAGTMGSHCEEGEPGIRCIYIYTYTYIHTPMCHMQ